MRVFSLLLAFFAVGVQAQNTTTEDDATTTAAASNVTTTSTSTTTTITTTTVTTTTTVFNGTVTTTEDDATTTGSSSNSTVTTTTTTITTTTVTTTTVTTTTVTVTTTTTVPASVVEVTADITGSEVLPTGVTASDLMSSSPYRSAKKTGISTALGVSSGAVSIDAFEITGRLRALSERKLSTTAVDVKTSFTVAVADTTAGTAMVTTISNAAESIKNETNTAMAAENWAGESVLTAAPTVSTPTVATPTVATVTTLTDGSFAVAYYTDSTCATAHSTFVNLEGAIGASGATNTCGAPATANTGEYTSMEVSACGAGGNARYWTSDASCTGAADGTGVIAADVCHPAVGTGVYMKLTCSSSAYVPPVGQAGGAGGDSDGSSAAGLSVSLLSMLASALFLA